MPLDIPIEIEEIIEEDLQPNLTYYMDFENGKIIGKVDGLQAIDQFIQKAILTQRFKNIIYDPQYGSEVHATVYDSGTTNELVVAELPRVITDCLIYDPRIEEVYDFEFNLSKENLSIGFHVRTIFGILQIQKVI